MVWMITETGFIHILRSRDKIEENCKVFEWKLSDDEMQLLEQALKKTII